MTNPTDSTIMTLGGIIDTMTTLRNTRRTLDKQSGELKKEYDELEFQLIQRLNDEDMIQAKGKLATATVTKSICPSITDWEAFEQYILDNEALYMLTKAVSITAYRDIRNTGDTVPGLEDYEKTAISLLSTGTK